MSPFRIYLELLSLPRISFEVGHGGRVRLVGRLPESLISAVKARKEGIKRVVRIDPVIVRSCLIRDEMFVWVSNDSQKVELVELGAIPGLVYTKTELEIIVEARRAGCPVEVLIESKALFDGRITRTLTPTDRG